MVSVGKFSCCECGHGTDSSLATFDVTGWPLWTPTGSVDHGIGRHVFKTVQNMAYTGIENEFNSNRLQVRKKYQCRRYRCCRSGNVACYSLCARGTDSPLATFVVTWVALMDPYWFSQPWVVLKL